MLIKRAILDGIAEGRYSLAFRRWNKAAVKAGSVFKTAVGTLRVKSIEEISPADITDVAARRAGYVSVDDVRDELMSRAGSATFRIALEYVGKDPRVALRAKARLGVEERDEIAARLDRLDSGKSGPWTRRALEAIRDFPGTPAGDLAARLGVEKEWLKLHVRKLKNLGLTISLEPGYRLSPRGKSVTKALRHPSKH